MSGSQEDTAPDLETASELSVAVLEKPHTSLDGEAVDGPSIANLATDPAHVSLRDSGLSDSPPHRLAIRILCEMLHDFKQVHNSL